MNNSKTPKIVVGAGLGVVYAVGLTMVMMRGGPDSNVAQPATVEVAAEMATVADPSVAIVSETADPSTSVVEQPVSRTEVPAASDAAKARSMESALAKDQGIGSGSTSARPAITDIQRPDPSGEVADIGRDAAISAAEAPSSEEVGSEPSEGEPSVGTVDVLTEDGEVD
jgi:hypothetical protein